MKGIILAGGRGSRLYPLTATFSKQLLPIYDKPMIYYPLSLMLFAGITEILIISTPRDIPFFQSLLQDGSQWGVSLSYEPQYAPRGIPEAFLIGERFIGQSPVMLLLGDNIFYGDGLSSLMKSMAKSSIGAQTLAVHVPDPERYGVATFNAQGQVSALHEKPVHPASHYAVTGCYVFDADVIEVAKKISPSDRGELEIVDVLNDYLQRQQLHVECLGRGTAWLDTGTPRSLFQASQFVEVVESRQGLKIACLEEIAYREGLIDKAQVSACIVRYAGSQYARYLEQMLEEEQACVPV